MSLGATSRRRSSHQGAEVIQQTTEQRRLSLAGAGAFFGTLVGDYEKLWLRLLLPARADVNVYYVDDTEPVSPGRRQPKMDEATRLQLERPTVFWVANKSFEISKFKFKISKF